MAYSPKAVREAYDNVAEEEDKAEKNPSLRTEIPREFIKQYLKTSDVVLDAGGGAGINAIMMAQRCKKVTLVDISPRILELAAGNIKSAGLTEKIDLIQGDITNLQQFEDREFSFVVCVGDSISYVLERGAQAIQELTRVADKGAILIIGCDSKYGFMRLRLSEGLLDEAVEMNETSETYCGMGPRTHLYTTDEMTALLAKSGCEVLKVASTPTFADTIDKSMYDDDEKWRKLKALELEVCTKPELLGMGDHLLFIARKM
ncbi:MAG: class I SAM-dependent methyltransferase [Candidatus Latescibacteria bacterium]|nr:class I SAM-dependent methyltransferase [Candidatus Latescibacterota bacterium]